MTAVLLALVVATGSPGPLPQLQTPEPAPFAVDPGSLQLLHATAERFASYWARGELEGVGRLLSSGGLVLHLERAGNTPLPQRRALAAIRDFVRGYESVGVDVLRVVDAGGSPPRGFAELRWIAVPAGTSEAVTVAVFVGFLEEEAGWRVSEIRVLR